MQAGYKVLNRYRLDNERYILTASKSVPAFKAGKVGEIVTNREGNETTIGIGR